MRWTRAHHVVLGAVLGCGGGSGGTDPDAIDSPGGGGGDAVVDVAGPCGDGTCAADETATTCCADCGVCSEAAYVDMETGVTAGVAAAGITPGGLADTHADFAGGPFTDVVFPMNVLAEPTVASSYFWAQQFFFEGTTMGGYTGLQTGGICGGANVGKMVIFSIWEAVAGTAGAGATCEVFAGEGTGQKCCRPFAWRQDVAYRMRLHEVATDQWELVLHDPTVPADLTIGTITTNAAYGRVRTRTAGFAEYFGTVAQCTTMPHAKVRMHAPSADGAAPYRMDAAPYGTCVAQATSTCSGSICQ